MEITLQIDPNLQARLDRIVKQFGHNAEYWLLELARVGSEDFEDSIIASKRRMEFEESGAEAIPLDEIIEKYDSND